MRLLLAAFLALAQPLFAATEGIAVQPADPTSAERVTLLVSFYASCPGPPVVTRNGGAIVLTLDPGICLSPPFLVTQRVELGVLPAGQYTVTEASGDARFKTSFTVNDANGSVRVFPWLGPTTGGNEVEVVAEIDYCLTLCPTPVITFGGIAGTNVRVLDRTHFRVTVPPAVAGAVAVRVTNGEVSKTSYAYRYYDPKAAPAPELFEKVLLPVFYNGSGMNGSRWATEFAIRNENSYPVTFYRGPDGLPSVDAGTTHIAGFEAAPGGVFLIVPRGSAAGLRFNAMIRDVSRVFEPWGTEIPVVREEDFARSITLLNAPAYPGFRTMLRIYSLNSVPTYVNITVTSMDTGATLHNHGYLLTSPEPCTSLTDCGSMHPATIALPNFTESLPVSSPSERVMIRVQNDQPIWAFLTITNNTTQHVTTISPQ